jgi:hypothetical protein
MTAIARLAGPSAATIQRLWGGWPLPILAPVRPRNIYDEMPDGAAQRSGKPGPTPSITGP